MLLPPHERVCVVDHLLYSDVCSAPVSVLVPDFHVPHQLPISTVDHGEHESENPGETGP